MNNHSSRSRRGLIDRFLSLIESTPTSDRILLRIAFFVVIATGIFVLLSINDNYIANTPSAGGELREGILGTPRFINPALAFTRADQDVASLIYSGLLRIDKNGDLVNDVAESIDISEDGRTYTIKVRRDVTFHDDTPLTARDVVYTLQLIQNPDLKSPLRGNWADVMITEIDEYTLTINLEEPYAPFVENLTVGIMPAHAWSDLPAEQLPFSQLNTEPIGSGPYQITDATRDTSGLITSYRLTAYTKSQKPANISELSLFFYQNETALETALREDDIDATAYIPTNSVRDFAHSHKLVTESLPRTFGLFYNQNRSTVLRSQAVRQALSVAIDREQLVNETVSGFGVPTDSPLPEHVFAIESDASATAASNTPTTASELLTEAGWEQNDAGLWEQTIDDEIVTLEVTIRTSNTPVFANMVDKIAAAWEAAGIAVVTEQFEQTGLIQSVIRPRDFEVLLFGLDMSRSYDLYPFWHSSQQDDPGLNVAQYANVEVDNLLETARTTQDTDERLEAMKTASDVITAEAPATLLFQPEMTYIIDTDVQVAEMSRIGRPADRYSNIAEWYTEEESLWPWFRTE